MDEKLFNPVPEKIPAPERLFHEDYKNGKEPVSVSRQKPIPRYKEIKRFSLGFLMIIVLLAIMFMNLEKFGVQFYYMKSSSMESVIPKGSFMVEYKFGVDKLQEGDIITYVNSKGVSVTHEIVEVIPLEKEKEVRVFRTKGRENKAEDKELATEKNICGKVIFHIPYIGDFLSNL